jgi:hypothetical protein
MFETSSILSMLGMGAQFKGASQSGGAVPVTPSSMQAAPGDDQHMTPQAAQNGSLFQLMLSYALPQTDTKVSLASTAPASNETVNKSISLPFNIDERETPTDQNTASASAMMPFYPVLWNAMPGQVPVNAAIAVDTATETSEGGPAPAVLSDAKNLQTTPIVGGTLPQTAPTKIGAASSVQSVTGSIAQATDLQAALAGSTTQAAGVQAASSGSQVQTPSAAVPMNADAKKIEMDAATAEALRLMTPVTDTKSEPQVSIPSTQANADLDVQAAATTSAQTSTMPVVPADIQINQPTAIAPAAPHVNPTVTVTTATQTATDVRVQDSLAPEMANVQARSIPSAPEFTAAEPTKNISSTDEMANIKVVNQMQSEPQAITAAASTRAEVTTAAIAPPVVAADASANAQPVATPIEAAAAVPMVQPAAVEPEIVPTAPAKNVAAHAWADSVVRRITLMQAEARSAGSQKTETINPALGNAAATIAVSKTNTSVPQARALATEGLEAQVQDVKDSSEQAPVQLQQKIFSAPDTQSKVHEAVMAAMNPDALKNATKSQTSTPAVQVSADAVVPITEQSVDKATTVPAIDTPLRAVEQTVSATVKAREDAQAPARSDAPDARLIKVDAPMQQPLVNNAEVQKQFVPLNETTQPLAPRVREEVFETIFKGVSTIKHTPSTVDVTLTPESLGTVTVKVAVEEGKMAARIDVQNADVKNIIEANLPRLHEALQSNGLTLDSVAVFVNNGSSFADKRNDAPKKRTSGSPIKIDDGFEPLSSLRNSKQYGYNTVEYIM